MKGKKPTEQVEARCVTWKYIVKLSINPYYHASIVLEHQRRTCAVRVTDYGNWVGLCVCCSTSPLVHLANDVRKIVWFSLKTLLCKGRRERIQHCASRRAFITPRKTRLRIIISDQHEVERGHFCFSFAEKISVQLYELLFALYAIMPPSMPAM